MTGNLPKDRISFFLPLMEAREADPIKHLDTRLSHARKLREAGWLCRPAKTGLIFETPSIEVGIVERLTSLGLPEDLIEKGLDGGPDAVPTVARYYAEPPRHLRGSPNVESPWLRHGELSLPSGVLMIGDPLNPSKQHRSVHLPPGEYLILVRALSAYNLVHMTSVRIAMDVQGATGEVIAEVPVNVDQIGFYDKVLGDVVNPAVPVYLGDGELVLPVREVTIENGGCRVGVEIATTRWRPVAMKEFAGTENQEEPDSDLPF
jgi:hypothetical protein